MYSTNRKLQYRWKRKMLYISEKIIGTNEEDKNKDQQTSVLRYV